MLSIEVYLYHSVDCHNTEPSLKCNFNTSEKWVLSWFEVRSHCTLLFFLRVSYYTFGPINALRVKFGTRKLRRGLSDGSKFSLDVKLSPLPPANLILLLQRWGTLAGNIQIKCSAPKMCNTLFSSLKYDAVFCIYIRTMDLC